MTLIEVVAQRRELFDAYMYWEMLYCADLQVVQAALRDGMLDSILRVAVPEVGTIRQGNLLTESYGRTELKVHGANEQHQIVHMGVYRHYRTLPVFALHVKNSTIQQLNELHQWLGKLCLVRVGMHDPNGWDYGALVAGWALETVNAWKARYTQPQVHVDHDLEDYRHVITDAQVADLLKAGVRADDNREFTTL